VDVSLALAFAAGLLSFVSPCVLALLPVYLAFLGESAAQADAVPAGVGGPLPWRGPILGHALLFIAGFSAVFVVLGVSFGLIGSYLFRADLARQVAGVLVVAIGVLTTGVFGSVMDRWRWRAPVEVLPGARPGRALMLGALVSVGWTPCIGPVLGTILTMGASSQQAGIAAVLLVAYSVGLAVPFLAAAVALPRLSGFVQALRRHHRVVEVVSGAFIIGIGVLIYTNAFYRISSLFRLTL
jgi:cytochrome c-type biogenesis protein